VVELLY